MLTGLSIRDVVLIEKLDLLFGAGLTALTGETGAGKSILLDSLGLALGQRAESGLVRAGAEQAAVIASFAPPADHPATTLLAEQGLTADADGLVLRRTIGKDGRSRAFVNDQPVGVALLRQLGALLVEVQGQNEQIGLADPANHLRLLDQYGVTPALRQTTAAGWRRLREALTALTASRAAIEEARREEEWLRHAAAELQTLAPTEGEEDRLAGERNRLQQGERRAEAIAAALTELAPRDRRGAGPAAALRSAARTLARLARPEDESAQPAMLAIERAEEAVAEAESLLHRLAQDAEADPRGLEQAEERLFALRAAARKHSVAVTELPALLHDMQTRLRALDTGCAQLIELERASVAARTAYLAAAGQLTLARRAAALRLERAVTAELPPLRLNRASFHVEINTLDEKSWHAGGMEGVRFLIATNPGQPPGAIDRIASGGELSRLMLALKVVLSSASSVPTLVFDEVDSGVGGATAAAVGDRLAAVARQVQVLVVTHSPQVAARGAAHLRVAKDVRGTRTETGVVALRGADRREEIARMLAGETVTDAARAAADQLLGAA